MQKNWYVLYTKPQCEKKVSTFLTKKRVENFIPLVSSTTTNTRRSKVVNKPLFKSLVFVYISENDKMLIKDADGVINFLYWLGKPAVINDTEVSTLKDFTTNYSDISLEKLPVNSKVVEKSIFRSSYEIEGNLVAIKNKTIKVNLPSLGYSMIANLNEESIFGREKLIQNITIAQS